MTDDEEEEKEEEEKDLERGSNESSDEYKERVKKSKKNKRIERCYGFDKVYKFCIVDGEITQLPSMIEARYNHCVVMFRGEPIFIGGESIQTIRRTVERMIEQKECSLMAEM